MWIRVNGNLKQRQKNVVKDVLEWGHNSHLLVDIVKPWKLERKMGELVSCSNVTTRNWNFIFHSYITVDKFIHL